MEVSTEELLEEAKVMALELRMKDRQIITLTAQLESIKKVTDEHPSERGGSQLGS